MGKAIFWLVWIMEVLAFVIGAGCFVIFMPMLGQSSGDKAGMFFAIALLFLLALGIGYSLYWAVTRFNRGAAPGKLALALLFPVILGFVFFGGCVVLFQ